jgi:hypothetical protein
VLQAKKSEEEALISNNSAIYTLSSTNTGKTDYSAEELERLKEALKLNLQKHANENVSQFLKHAERGDAGPSLRRVL